MHKQTNKRKDIVSKAFILSKIYDQLEEHKIYQPISRSTRFTNQSGEKKIYQPIIINTRFISQLAHAQDLSANQYKYKIYQSKVYSGNK